MVCNIIVVANSQGSLGQYRCGNRDHSRGVWSVRLNDKTMNYLLLYCGFLDFCNGLCAKTSLL